MLKVKTMLFYYYVQNEIAALKEKNEMLLTDKERLTLFSLERVEAELLVLLLIFDNGGQENEA